MLGFQVWQKMTCQNCVLLLGKINSLFLLSIPRHTFLLPLLAWSFFNILIPPCWRKKPWTYFSLVSWLSPFPVGACSKEDSWNQGRGWCHLQAPSRGVGYPHSTLPYASPPLLHGQQRGKAGSAMGTSQPAKVGLQLLLQSFLTQPGKGATRFGSWFLEGASRFSIGNALKIQGNFAYAFDGKNTWAFLIHWWGWPHSCLSHFPNWSCTAALPSATRAVLESTKDLLHVSSYTALAHSPAHKNTNMLLHTRQEPQSTKTI